MSERNRHLFSRSRFKAVIFDLDGVITETAGLHAAAWKQMFDEFLQTRGERPFDSESDYKRYVDGKPRYDGVKSFLESRGIDLPMGSPSDPPDRHTVSGLGNRKNRLFQDLLQQQGVSVYDSTIKFIRQLRDENIATAVISSSKNCGEILETAGITHLFDVRVDGIDSEKLGIAGKPAPQIFLEAADRLGVAPGDCIIVEDSIAGVQAGKRGSFGLVIGVDRTGKKEVLEKKGVDIVVKDLSEFEIRDTDSDGLSDIGSLPPALDEKDRGRINDRIKAMIRGRRPVVFLDYDGTLAPIVNRPEDAILTYGMKKTLLKIASRETVAIVSGRGLEDVESRVGLEEVIYAGSHGFEIKGPEGLRLEHPEGERFLPILEKADAELKEALAEVPGVRVERKKYAIAVHFRQVSENRMEEVDPAVRKVAGSFPELLMYGGKKVFEIRPDIDWDKGKAVRWIMDALDLNREEYLPIYIGDDTTDEDAFRELSGKGLGILVAEGSGSTNAQYVLVGTEDVRRFLDVLAEWTDMIGKD